MKKIALFDLDGTLISGDTQKKFFFWVLKFYPKRIFSVFFWLFLFPVMSLKGRRGMKRAFFSFLWNFSQQDLVNLAKSFADFYFPQHCYSQVIEELRKHQRKGVCCVLISASPEFYLSEIGKRLGFDLVLGSQLEITSPMAFLPRLKKNNRGDEKVFRLRRDFPEWFSSENFSFDFAYSDSSADIPILLLCREVRLIYPSSRLQKFAKKKKRWQRLL